MLEGLRTDPIAVGLGLVPDVWLRYGQCEAALRRISRAQSPDPTRTSPTAAGQDCPPIGVQYSDIL